MLQRVHDRFVHAADAAGPLCETRERATRIELAFSAWEADVLPLNYARVVVLNLAKVLLSGYVRSIGRSRWGRRDPGVTFT